MHYQINEKKIKVKTQTTPIKNKTYIISIKQGRTYIFLMHHDKDKDWPRTTI